MIEVIVTSHGSEVQQTATSDWAGDVEYSGQVAGDGGRVGDARLQVGEGVLEQRDGALGEAVGVERLLPGGRLQVVRRLQADIKVLPPFGL